jgi:diaminohydroxyphosphoribosylaminopyrimidine deaminase/5-amino-6-(5-phosphoribosylamino)uracil reductase
MFVDSIEALLTACYERQLQSLVVEGGCDTLQRFIDRGIWDEIRVETGSVTSSEGTRSPVIPPQLKQHRVEHYGDNTVTYYLNQQ